MPNFRGTPKKISRVISLGTGAVSTGTHLIGAAECKGVVKEIRFYGQAAVTGTSITADCKKLSADGNTSTSLQSAATDIKLTASTDETELAASLSSTGGVKNLLKDQLVECVITATSITAGPGDVLVEIIYEPRA